MEHTFEKYAGICYNRAAHWATKTGIDIDTMISAGHDAFVKTMKDYKEDKSKFSTYYWTRCGLEMMNCAEKERIRTFSSDCEPSQIAFSTLNAENMLIFKETLSTLSSDCQNVLNIVLNTPADLISMTLEKGNGRLTKCDVKRYLTLKKRWSHSRVSAAFKQIRNTI